MRFLTGFAAPIHPPVSVFSLSKPEPQNWAAYRARLLKHQHLTSQSKAAALLPLLMLSMT